MGHLVTSPYLGNGTPEKSVEATPYAPGDVGGVIQYGGRTYQKVRVFDPVAAAAEKAAAEKAEEAEEEAKKLEPHKEKAKAEPQKADAKAPAAKESDKAKAPKAAPPIEAGQLAFWQDPAAFVVTNDVAAAVAGSPAGSKPTVAGVFGGPVPPGSYCWIAQRGRGIKVKCASASVGQSLMANDSGEAAGGEPPKPAPLGVVLEPPVDGLCTASLDIQSA